MGTIQYLPVKLEVVTTAPVQKGVVNETLRQSQPLAIELRCLNKNSIEIVRRIKNAAQRFLGVWLWCEGPSGLDLFWSVGPKLVP